MRNLPPAIDPALAVQENQYANPARTWQLIMTGDLPDPIPPALIADLGRLLDLRPDVGSLVIETDDGDMFVARDWPSDRMEEADELLIRIRSAAGVRSVTMQERIKQ